MVDNTIDNLIYMGFSENEAKSYIALLKENPATAYEMAKKASVPTSKIYEVIGKLLEKRAILEIEDGSKTKYIPQSSDELLDTHKLDFENRLESLRTGLSGLKKDSDLSYIWNITDYDYLLNKAVRMIQSSRKAILLSIWPEEYELLKVHLKKAGKTGVKISIIHFGTAIDRAGLVFDHPIQDTLYSEKGGRGIVLVTDSEEVLIGTISLEERNLACEGAVSKNRGFVIMAEDYIKHDIYIMKIVGRFNDLLIKTFGINYAKLRDVFSDKEER